MKTTSFFLRLFLCLHGVLPVPINIGENCGHYMSGVSGICKKSRDCPTLVASVMEHGYHNLTRCGFHKKLELVCCPDVQVTIGENRNNIPPGIPKETTLDQVRKDCKYNNDIIAADASPQILKGTKAVVGEFPHMAALGFLDFNSNNYTFFCGGSVISERFVLTAAHCLVKQFKAEFVRIGAVDITKPGLEGVDYNVERQIINPNYKPRRKDNDIALLKLVSPIKVTKTIRFACLYDKEDIPEVMIATGWGTTEENGRLGSAHLQKISLTHNENQQCSNVLDRSILDSQLCAFSNIGGDTCQGDSGGPLQTQLDENDIMSVVGITSIGMGCGNSPGIYTKVYYYLDWIVDVIHGSY